MRRGLWAVGLLASLAVGCASSTKLEDEARMHRYRADAAAQARDYETAASEQDEANRLHEKAVKRAYKEGRTSEVIVPSAIPPAP